MFASYKADRLERIPPADASVVIFHGKPKPIDVLTGWVPEVWKVGGMTRAELDSVCNTAMEKLLGNVRTNSARNLLWYDLAEPHDGHAVIVGGGPSVKGKVDEIRWRQSLGQKVWALNGSADWLRGNDIEVDFHVMADARPENIEFVRYPSLLTQYLISSQCDPAVFDHLACEIFVHPVASEPLVTLWHPNTAEYVPLITPYEDKPQHLFGGGSTVGLNAIALAFGAGYRKIHLYGFDSSYAAEQHHVYKQGLNDGDRVIDVLFGTKKFKSTPWMVQQTNEFLTLAAELIEDDCIITVAGDGLLPTAAREMMANPVMTPAQQRASEVLKRIADVENPRGAEIGVLTGKMSEALLRGNEKLRLNMIDSWEGDGAAYATDTKDYIAALNQQMQDSNFKDAVRAVEFTKDRTEIYPMRSVDAAFAFQSNALDFVFIDADHSYEGCKADIEAWWPKVKPGGWLCGHDYENTDYPQFGVKRAVDEFVAAHNLTLEIGENFTWFTRKENEDVNL
jgi:hypothetical protein